MLWGSNAKDDNGYRGVFAEHFASAAQMAAARFLETNGRGSKRRSLGAHTGAHVRSSQIAEIFSRHHIHMNTSHHHPAEDRYIGTRLENPCFFLKELCMVTRW